MTLEDKLAVLADAAKYDASCASSGAKRKGLSGGLGNADGTGICHSYTPDGRCVSLLKILLTNFCVYDCRYCINRISSDVRRASFEPDEVVSLTLDFYRRNYIEGLFLSSGVLKTPDYTMERMIAVARKLRMEFRFNGYIHLKLVPGASQGLIDAAGLYADRLSANIELPTVADLVRLAPEKKAAHIDDAMSGIKRGIDEHADTDARAPKFAPAGQSTQMIVGATESSDADILATATRLYDQFKLRRVYFSGYSPIQSADPRLPPAPPPLLREHRLYQADWLIRHYGFVATELASPGENLSLEMDPKLAWAVRHPERFPVDLSKATKEELLRVPGLGVRTVNRILAMRRHQTIKLADLEKLGAFVKRAARFLITADGKRPEAKPKRPKVEQLSLFAEVSAARTGEL